MSNQDTAVIEAWKDVVGYEGFYQVSDRGGVRSVDRWAKGSGSPYLLRGKLLRLVDHSARYKQVNLWRHGKLTQVLVHRLVLEAFVGPPPDEDSEGCHNNGRRYDNRLGNLRWDTRRGNARDMRKHGTAQVGERQHMAKLTEDDVRRIRRMSDDGIPQRVIAHRHKVCQMTVSLVVRRVTWTHV